MWAGWDARRGGQGRPVPPGKSKLRVAGWATGDGLWVAVRGNEAGCHTADLRAGHPSWPCHLHPAHARWSSGPAGPRFRRVTGSDMPQDARSVRKATREPAPPHAGDRPGHRRVCHLVGRRALDAQHLGLRGRARCQRGSARLTSGRSLGCVLDGTHPRIKGLQVIHGFQALPLDTQDRPGTQQR